MRDTCPKCKKPDAINVNTEAQTTQCRFCDYSESPERDFTSLVKPTKEGVDENKMNTQQPFTRGPYTYTPHNRDEPRGHIFIEEAAAACVIELHPAASASQEWLNIHGRLFAAAPALYDRVLGRLDRCACHPATFDPNKDEGRGAGTCAECEADSTVLALVDGLPPITDPKTEHPPLRSLTEADEACPGCETPDRDVEHDELCKAAYQTATAPLRGELETTSDDTGACTECGSTLGVEDAVETALAEYKRSIQPKLYLLRIVDDIEPEVLGPFATDELRFEKAKELKAENENSDGLFPFYINSSKPMFYTYSAGSFAKDPE